MIDNEVYTKRALIIDVAKRLDLKEDIVKEVFENNLKYIRWLCADSSTLSIKLPFVGTIYFHLRSWKRDFFKRKTLLERGKDLSAMDLRKYIAGEQKVKKLREYNQMLIDTERMSRTTTIKHFKKKFINSRLHSGNLRIGEIEVIQNEYAEQ
jgi:hypothetical protein